ncbi:MAG: hypothetical protein KatS3mg068_0852 [Candidatus Sericytochromatia bacterium]|nr:MAG: hypothetical protein KatS3mg068_0852 [Candidatus Sericytochromatia bacterium]
MKVRIDKLLVDRNIFESKKKAQTAIISGLVKVDNKTIYKPGTLININKEI